MALTVVDSKDLVTYLQTGEAPVPKEVAEDNARRGAADAKEAGKTATAAEGKTAATGAEAKTGETATQEGDDVEDAEGLTPKQKRELSATMLKAIGKKHREKKEAEEFAADQYNNRRLAEQRAQELEQRLAALEKPAVKAEEPKEPVRASFQSDAEYQDALIDWKVDQRLRKTQAEEADRHAQEEQNRVVQAATERLRAAAELVPDFAEVTDKELNVPGHIAAYMQRSPMFAELGYHFGQHPEVLAELRKLPPAEALVELGVIKSTLRPFSETHKATGKATNGSAQEPSAASNGTTPSTQTGSSPSKPRGTAPVITPLPAGGASQVEKDPREMNIRETISDWQKKNQRNLGLRKRH